MNRTTNDRWNSPRVGGGLGRWLGSALLTCGLVAAQDGQPGHALAGWRFDRDGELLGWRANGHLTNVAVVAGALHARAVGPDPILELQPLLDFEASPWQCIEIRLKASREGTAEFFWSGTPQGRYGGFAQEKRTSFAVQGDSQWHTYRILPCWHGEKRIVRLRFDPYDGADFAVDSIRIVKLPMPPPVRESRFDFTQGPHGWQGYDGVELHRLNERLTVALRNGAGFVLGPPVSIEAASQSYVSLQMATRSGTRATFFFVSDQVAGLQSHSFPVVADGREHVYNLDMLAARNWRGRILALGLRPTDTPGGTATLRWLGVAAEPQGPAELEVLAFALEDALPRVGRTVRLRAIASNRGGALAANLRAELKLPAGVRELGPAPGDQAATPARRAGPPAVEALGFAEQTTWTWSVQADRALRGEARLEIRYQTASHDDPGSTPGQETAVRSRTTSARAMVEFTAPLGLASTGYVPEPRPVRGPCEVGVYYFPGWKSASQWQPIQSYPERKPVLGWYAEGKPEVADWHIKWAVEHGITFFVYDWYWSQGVRQLEHALHEGYFNARYRKLLKFCLLWANHNAPHTSSLEDCVAVTRHWIQHYFTLPEYLTVETKPVVVIFSPERLTQDLGGEGVQRAFDAMGAECRRAGLPGIHLIACVGGAGQARQAANEKYDSVTAYTWPGLGVPTGRLNAPFASLLEGYQRNWRHILEQTPIPLLVPVCGGWDSRPWHGENDLVRFGRTPALFSRHLRGAKQFLDLRAREKVARDPTAPQPRRTNDIENMILIEAWNEWGEGSYIEPHQEFGFGYLDAVRDVFTSAPHRHTDPTPADAGLGPYDVPPLPTSATAWEFGSSDNGWANVMDLTGVRLDNGALTARTTGNDPALFGPPMHARSAEFSVITIRLRLESAGGRDFTDHAQIFWRTSQLAESEAASERFEVQGDGQWHEYRVAVMRNPRWRGIITRLRLDPCTRPGVTIELSGIRLGR